MDILYQQGLLALQDGNRLKAQDNLRQVVSIDPNYQDATRYLHLLATGVDMTYLHYQLEQQQWAIQRAEAQAWAQGRQVRHTRRQQRQQERTLFMAIFGSVSLILVILCIVLLSISIPVAFQAFIWANSPASASFTGTINDGSLEQSQPTLPVAQATSDHRATAFAIAAAVDRPTATFTSSPTGVPTATPKPTDTPRPTPTQTAIAAPSTNLSTTNNSPLPTPTPVPTNTDTPVPTETAIALPTATPMPTQPTTAVGKAGVFGTQLSVLTYEFKAPQIPVKPGDLVTISLEWEVLERMDADYDASVQLLTQIDGPWLPSFGQVDLLLESGGQPTSQWAIGQKVKINYPINLSRGARPGIYRVAVVVYNSAEPTQRMPVVPGEATGRLGDDILILQETKVEA